MGEQGQAGENWTRLRDEWVLRVTELVNEVTAWAEAQGWAVERTSKTITEKSVGSYEVPVLLIALRVAGEKGRVDLEAYPTLNRVSLVGRNGSWLVLTDSNVPLHAEWNKETFVQLAAELLA